MTTHATSCQRHITPNCLNLRSSTNDCGIFVIHRCKLHFNITQAYQADTAPETFAHFPLI